VLIEVPEDDSHVLLLQGVELNLEFLRVGERLGVSNLETVREIQEAQEVVVALWRKGDTYFGNILR